MGNPEKLKLAKDVGLKAIAFAIARVPESMRVYLGGSDFKVYEADLAAAKVEPKELYGHESYVTGVALAGKTLVSGGYDGRLTWFDTDGKQVHELRGHAEKTPNGFGSMLYAASFSADGKHLATGDKVGKVKVWEVDSGKPVAEVEAPVMYTWDAVQRLHSIGGIRSLAFSP